MTIKIGDKVVTGVFVLGEFKPVYTGIVVAQNCDGTVSDVDVGSITGGRPWIHKESTCLLRKVKE